MSLQADLMLVGNLHHIEIHITNSVHATNAPIILVVDGTGSAAARMTRLLESYERSMRVSFADIAKLCATKKEPPSPGERPRIVPVLGPPPFNPRNTGMDIRRFLPRRV